MRNPKRILTLLLLPLAFAAANAQDKAQKPQKTRQAPSQAANPYVERFQKLDSNKDGYVTPAEWPLERTKFDLVDRNNDGRLSRAELLTPNVVRDPSVNDRLQQVDTNRDGRLSREERERGRLVNQARDTENVWNPHSTPREQNRFRDLDRNRDNRLSRPELTGAGARFDRLDRNKDGVVSPREWPRP